MRIRLNWRNTTWEDYKLIDYGWTFELTAGSDLNASVPVNLDTPCPVLMVAPQTQAPEALRSKHHYNDLADRLDHAWPATHSPPERIGDWEKFVSIWNKEHPRILYYYGPAECENGELYLHFEAQGELFERRALGELIAIWQHRPPQIVLFNIVTSTPLQTNCALSKLAPGVPLAVIQTATIAEVNEAQKSVLNWFYDVLETGEDMDPVAALNRHGLASATAWTAYKKWHTQIHDKKQTKDKLARFLIDRKIQRNAVLGAASKLLRERERRLYCILAYGDSGNCVELFGDQIYKHLRVNLTDVHIDRQRLHLPIADAFDSALAEREVCLKLGHGSSVEEVLKQYKSKSSGPKRTILLLDWGLAGTHS